MPCAFRCEQQKEVWLDLGRKINLQDNEHTGEGKGEGKGIDLHQEEKWLDSSNDDISNLCSL